MKQVAAEDRGDSGGSRSDLNPVGSTDDPTRSLIRQILSAVGEYERSMIRLRMRAGKDAKKRNGGFIGGQVPTGYCSVNGEPIED